MSSIIVVVDLHSTLYFKWLKLNEADSFSCLTCSHFPLTLARPGSKHARPFRKEATLVMLQAGWTPPVGTFAELECNRTHHLSVAIGSRTVTRSGDWDSWSCVAGSEVFQTVRPPVLLAILPVKPGCLRSDLVCTLTTGKQAVLAKRIAVSPDNPPAKLRAWRQVLACKLGCLYTDDRRKELEIWNETMFRYGHKRFCSDR